MKVLDGINLSGLGNVCFASKGTNQPWQMRREMR